MIPTFTVVVPCRNRSRLLHRALASLDRQSFDDFETLVVDDGSTEDLSLVTAAFPRLAPRLIRTEPGGASQARNVGADLARAPHVAYLDSDDAFLPEKLANAARRIAAEPGGDILASAGYVLRAGGALQPRPGRPIAPGEDISDFYFASGERFLTSSLVVRTAVACAVRWDERLRKVQDPDFVIRTVRAGHRLSYAATPDVILYDDVQAGRISDAVALDSMRDWLARSGHLLTPRARAGFEVYALAYEAARLDRLRGLGQLAAVAAGGRAPWPLVAKSLYRLLVPAAVFKATARLAPTATRNGELVAYLRSLEAVLAPPAAG